MAVKKQKKVTFVSRRASLQIIKKMPVSQNNPYVYEPGEFVQFAGGTYSTSDPEMIEWLRGHALFEDGDGFIEVAEPVPAVGSEITALTAAAAAQDRVAAERVLEDEQAGFQREVVIEAARATIAQIDAAVAAVHAAGGKAA